jgi:hypothetical protein
LVNRIVGAVPEPEGERGMSREVQFVQQRAVAKKRPK